MPRAKLVREPCDCLDCREPLGKGASGAAAVARHEPPPKSLVLCLTGELLAASSLEEADVPHLKALVQGGCSGLLACRSGGPPLPLQLFGLPHGGVPPAEGLPERFKGLRAVLLTNSPSVAQAGVLAGCYAVHQLEQETAELAEHICKLVQVKELCSALQNVGMAPALASVLAAAAPDQAEEEGDDAIDMVVVILDVDAAHAASSAASSSGSSSAPLEWADRLLRQLNLVPGFRDAVLMTLVLGLTQQELAQQLLSQERHILLPGLVQAAPQGVAKNAEETSTVAVLRPQQSYQFAGLDPVDVDPSSLAIVVHRLPGVIRVDDATRLGIQHIAELGGASCILSERMLPELAYKLGRAPKYGA